MLETKEQLHKANQVTLSGSVVNLILASIKLVAGIFGSSAAMIADSVHSLSDFATDLVVLITYSISKRPRDENHNYGHGKVETLGTLVIGSSLLAVGGGLIFSGLRSVTAVLSGETLDSPGFLALGAALVSIIVKEILFHLTRNTGRTIGSKALEANAWHHRSDAMSSVAAFLGIGGALLLGSDYAILDPLAGLVVSGIICWVAWKILRGCVDELAEASVDQSTRDQILTVATEVQGVQDPHNLRTRWVGSELALDLHIRVKGSISVDQGHEIATNVEQELRKVFGEATMLNIHVEPERKTTMKS
jgi:cation diffusion facilitator family transporter